MAMPLADFRHSIRLGRQSPLLQNTGVRAEAHRSALVHGVALIGHEIDDRVRRLLVELRRVGAVETTDVPCELDDGELHPEADAEIRKLALPGETNGGDLSL